MESRSFIVACGGTGGHVFPGLAVAREMRERGHNVEVWLSGRDVEQAACQEWDGPRFATGAKFLKLESTVANIRAWWRCHKAMKARKPDALLAMGSYTSLPPVLAARVAGVPVVLHEANAVPGKAVETLSRIAYMTATSFEETGRWLPGRKISRTGLPVRCGLVGEEPLEGVPEGRFTVLVTGGSQGAHGVNKLVCEALCLLHREVPGRLHVVHQSGAADVEWVRERYAEVGASAQVVEFIAEMGRAYAAADLVVARAGASTCWELALLAKPALLIPLPTAIRNHQHVNAKELARAGGVDLGVQAELTPRSVMRYLHDKMDNPERLERMSEALRGLAVPDAARRLAELLEGVVGVGNGE